MWEVWLYIGVQRKLIDRFHSRNEAEHCVRSYQRLCGFAAQLTVCYTPTELAIATLTANL